MVRMNATQRSQNDIRADSTDNAAAPSISVLAAVTWRRVGRTLLRDGLCGERSNACAL